MDYVELHLHTSYSILDGLDTPEGYMARAAELGITHAAQTDHGTTSGHRAFQRAASKFGIVPILGMEGYISATDRFDRRAKNARRDGTQTFNHITLLAQNETGLRNLNAVSREAWQSGFYHKPRTDMDLLEEHSEGLIVLSGCLNGLLCKALAADDYDGALARAQQFKRIFGDRFFIEIMGHNPPDINAGLLELADDVSALPVITSDCHHARKEDLWVQEALLILSTKPKFGKSFDLDKSRGMDMLDRFNYLYPDRKMSFQEFGIHLNQASEHMAKLSAQGIGTDPITNTRVVADMIGDYPYHEGLDFLPEPTMVLDDENDELARLAFNGLKDRGLDDKPEYVQRLKDELATIAEVGFATYFIILADVVGWAREQGIFIGPGRGSGVSSLVNYCLHITNIDPIPHKLLFFRFLDPSRGDVPDIDVDIEVKRRWEIKEYLARKYGHVANIMTFNAFRGKAAIKAAASVYRIPQGEVNRAVKGLTDDPEFPVLDMYAKGDSTREFRRKYPEILPLARELEGSIRSTGIHAGGIVLSKRPIEDFVPIETRIDPQDEAKGRVPVVAVDMNEAAQIGLIKYDFLGLNNLTVAVETIRSVRERTGREIDLYRDLGSLDDPDVYAMLSEGHTRGVFQAEGGPYTNTILKMGGVRTFDDLVSSNALVRPGAADSHVGERYIEGKVNGNYEYIHQDAKYFTEDTYGQILFQEQQMLLCTEIAGLTMGEANQVRKAISKKILEDLRVWEPAFVSGAAKKIGEQRAQELWDDLEKSAAYAFNKAHSVGYSMITYWTAWLKYHYPADYMCALLNNLSGSDKAVKAMFTLMEAKRLGVPIRLPHVNKSSVKNTVEDGGIRLGLSSVSGIGDKSAHKIVQGGPYENYEALTKYGAQKGSGVTKGVIAALNKIGAAAFPDNPRTGSERDNFYDYLHIPAFKSQDFDPHLRAQFRPVNEYSDHETFVVCAMVYNVKVGPHWTLVEYVDESGSAASFTSTDTKIEKGTMYVMLISNNSITLSATTDEILEGEGGSFGKFLRAEELKLNAGERRCLHYSQRKIRTGANKGQQMASAIFTDQYKNLEGMLIFEGMLDAAHTPCTMGARVKIKTGTTRGGAKFLKAIET